MSSIIVDIIPAIVEIGEAFIRWFGGVIGG